MSDPLVSVLIRSMDRPTLERALASVAAQTYPAIEIVVVAACGGRHRVLPDRIGAFACRLVVPTEPLDRARAANAALDAAYGDWLNFLDDDDEFLPDHVATLVAALRGRAERFAFSRALLIDREGAERGSFGRPVVPWRRLDRGFFNTVCALFSRQLIAAGVRVDERFVDLEDLDLWVQCATRTEFVFVERITARYHMHIGDSGMSQAENYDPRRFLRARAMLREKWLGRIDLAEPTTAAGWVAIARELRDAADWEGAGLAVDRALALTPDSVDALFLRAVLREQAGDKDGAESVYRRLLTLRPDSVGVLVNLGILLRNSARAAESVAVLERAYALQAAAPVALNLTLALLEAREFNRARSFARQCSERHPGPAWYEIAGTAARLSGDIAAAEGLLEKAVETAPGSAGAWHELAQARYAGGDGPGGRTAFERARVLAPEWERLQWNAALEIPALMRDESDIEATLCHIDAGLDRIAARVARYRGNDPMRLLGAAVGITTFNWQFLPRDTTALQSRFGDLIVETVAAAVPRVAGVPAPRPRRARPRIGFVSPYWGQHTVSRYFSRFATELDPKRFERCVWHLGPRIDARVQAVANAVDRFRHADMPVLDVMALVNEAELDAVVYLDLGMDPRQHVLAAARLAPLQIALYGHPATTGLATIDVCLGGDLLEPADGDSHYRERLIRLPDLGAAPERWTFAADRSWFQSVRSGRPAIVCAQNLSKLIPAMDASLARIARASGAELFFIERGRNLEPRFLARLAPHFDREGLAVGDVVRVLPMQSYERYFGLLESADLILDTPWFSGGATSLDAISIGAPVVAWELGPARGRQTAAMLRLAGAPELIAHDAASFEAIALQLLESPAQRAAIGARLGSGADALFDARAALTAFAETLTALLRR
jgi:predicted O-linked N-acetylglucosamine transferase (SPINDLY family)